MPSYLPLRSLLDELHVDFFPTFPLAAIRKRTIVPKRDELPFGFAKRCDKATASGQGFLGREAKVGAERNVHDSEGDDAEGSRLIAA